MEKQDIFKSFYESYQEAIDQIESHHTFPEYFYDVFLAGKSTIYQKNISETKTFDEEWIRTVESYFPSLNKISMDPKSVLRYDEEVVVIEKARKINSQSIRHLAANTHNIKEVKDDGMVVPKKILTTFADLEYGTYENRMVMTLIDKLFYFVRHRYEIIKNNVESYQKNHFNLESEFPINNTQVTLKVDMVLKDDLDNKKINEYNKNLLQRVEHLNKLVTALKSSKFMELMATKKKVYPPLIKSNIIMKNTDYKNAYMLWLFLDRYNTLTFDVDVKEKDLTFDENYLKDIYQTTLINFATIAYNQSNRKELYDAIKAKKYRRRGLKVIKRHPDDLILNPDPIEVEDLTINQYYLEKFKTFFKRALDYHEGEAKTYETSLKRALRETIQITNTLYDSFFELNEEEDVFRRLIKDQDPVVELRDAKEKALIAKMIREVKEVDYKDSIRQEKRLLTQIAKLDQKLINASKNNKLITSKRMRSEESLKKEKLQANNRKKLLDKKVNDTAKNTKELAKLKQKIHKDINDLARTLKAEEKAVLDQLKLELRDKLKQEKIDLKEKYDREIEKLRTKQQNLIQALKDKEAKDKAKQEALMKKRLEAEKLRAKTQHDTAIKKEEARQKLRLEKEKQRLEAQVKKQQDKANATQVEKPKPDSKPKTVKPKAVKPAAQLKKVKKPKTVVEIKKAEIGLNNVLAKALKQTARSEGVKNYHKLKKNDLISMLAKMGYVPVEGELPLEDLLFTELRELATKLNLKDFDKLKKKDLIALIRNKQNLKSKKQTS
ncbi:hypothetical protein [Acholeplasma laidlawii]|uniref:hypothetical protein n=1 Tax=Acholeplasma laidlawii TaxID=2148 RepID=UPI0021F7D085|nr:hypothetical protein [Acholeplasma laidlawii]